MIARRVIHLAAAGLLALGSMDALAQEARGRGAGDPERGALEERVRRRFAETVQRRLGLTDEQLRRLRETNARLETRRREIVRTERETRMTLRRELMRGDSANQDVVRRGTDALVRARRDHVTLLEEEAKALDEFLSPVQRARYLAMQEELRMRMAEMRRGRGMRGAPGGAGRGEPGRPPHRGDPPPP